MRCSRLCNAYNIFKRRRTDEEAGNCMLQAALGLPSIVVILRLILAVAHKRPRRKELWNTGRGGEKLTLEDNSL